MKLRKALAYILVLMLLFADLGAVAEGLTLKLPAALKTVGEEAFYGNTSLGRVVVPDGTTRISARAFANSSVSEVELPDTLTYIADDAFAGCGDIAFSVPENCYAYDWCVRMGYISTEASFEQDEVWLRVGESVVNPATFKGSAGEFTYESSDPECVTVDQTGTIRAIDCLPGGYAVITATSVKYPNKTAQCRVYTSNEPSAIAFSMDTLVMGGVSGSTADRLYLLFQPYNLIRVTPENADVGKLTFETGDPSVATVDAEGVVTAKTAYGETTLTVRTENGLSATVPLKVLHLQITPKLEPASGTYACGMEDSFRIQYNADSYDCYYLEYDTSLLSTHIDLSTNTISFRVIGDVTTTTTAQIRVRSSYTDTLKATFTATLMPAAKLGQVDFENQEICMKAGSTRANAARCLKNTLCSFTYESDHPDYVSVTADGTLSAHKNTDANVEYVTITARSEQNANVVATCRVYVNDMADQLYFNADFVKMGGKNGSSADQMFTTFGPYKLMHLPDGVSESDLLFEIGDTNIATVNSAGTITPKVASGETTLTVRTASGLSATVPLKIQKLKQNPVTVPASGVCGMGMEGSFAVDYQGDNYGCYYILYDTDLLEIEYDVKSDLQTDTIRYRLVGDITSPKTTKFQMMSSYSYQQMAVYTLTLLPAPKQGQVSFAHSALRMQAGDTLANAAVCAENTLCEFTYESDHPEYVSVAADGTLTAHKNTDDAVGYVTITARSRQNLSVTATCRVYVRDTRDTIGFNADCLRMGGVSGSQNDVLDPMFSFYKLIRYPESEDAGKLTFEVADTSIASVSSAGLVTAKVASGETTLTVRTESGLSASIPLKIFNLQLNPTIEPVSGEISAAMEGSFKIQYDENSYSSSYLTYDSDLLEITHIDVASDLHSDTVHFRVKGVVTAPVTTKIEAHHSSTGALKGTYTLTIYPTPTWGQVTIDSDKYMEIGMGDTSLSVHATCAEGTLDEIRYSSNREQYVTVDPMTGALTAVKPMPKGMTATITAYALHNVSAKDTCTVATFDAPTDIAFARSYLKLGVGETLNLREDDLLVYTPDTARCTFKYESSAPERISVDAKGTITANAKGSAIITATSYNGIAKSITVYAYESSDLPTLEPASDVKGSAMQGAFRVVFPMGSYQSYRVEYDQKLLTDLTIDRVTEKPADTITYTVAEITEAVDTQIVLKKADGTVLAAYALRAVPAPKAGDVSLPEQQRDLVLGLGNDTYRMTPVCAEDTLSDFKFTSDHPEYVSVDADTGVLNAKKITPDGVYAAITAVSVTNPEASVTGRVTVVAAPESLTRTAAYIKTGAGDSVDLFGEGLFVMQPAGAMGNLVFSSSNPEAAKVDENGKVTCLKKGSAVISAHTYNGLSASITVYVYDRQAVPQLSANPIDIGEGSTGKLDIVFESGSYRRYRVESASDLITIGQIDTTTRTFTDTVTFTTGSVSKATEAKIRILDMEGAELAVCTVKIYPAPETITCTPAQIVMGVGEEGYAVQAASPDGTMCNFIYTSDGESIVSVAPNGALTAKGEGTAKITVSADNSSAKAECTVTVKPKPTGISMTRSVLKLGEGETFNIAEEEDLLKLEPADCKTQLHFTSSNVYYAAVDQNGLVTAKHPGKSTVRVTTHNGFSCAITVHVFEKGTVLADIQPEQIEIGANMNGSIRVTFNEGCYSRFTAEPESGLITVTGYDRATDDGGDTVYFRTGMTAQRTQTRVKFVNIDGTVIGYANVTILPGPTTVTIADVDMGIGEKDRYVTVTYGEADRMCAFEYESDAPDIAIVDNETNLITGLSEGAAHITARSTNSAAVARFTVTVHRDPMLVDYEDLENVGIAAGDTIDIPAPHVFDGNNEEMQVAITYAVDNSAIAKVEGNRVTGVKAGSTVLTASTSNGLSAQFTLTVSQDTVTGVAFDETDVTLYTDDHGYEDTVALSAHVLGKDITHGSLRYSLVGTSSAITVTQTGIVHAQSVGDAQVTATAFNGVTAAAPCDVHVRRLTSTLALDQTAAELGEGMTLQLTPIFDAGTGARVVWSTSNPDVALVSMDGEVIAIGAGAARISAKVLKDGEVYNNLEAYADITVIAGPTGISMRASELNLAKGEEVNISDLYTILAKNDSVWRQVTVKAQDETIVKIEDGKLTALETGTTTLLFTTCNGYTGQMTLNVVESAELAQNGFVWTAASLSMISGLKQKPEIKLNFEGVRRGYTLEIENPEGKTVLLLDEDGQLNAVETGTAALRMMLNADEAQPKTLVASADITVYTYQDIQMNIPAEKYVTVGEIVDFNFAITYPENLICDIPLTYSLSNDYVQFAPMQTVLSRGNAYAGASVITAGDTKGTSTDLTFFENPNLTCVIRIPLPRYRALIISEYDKNAGGNSLPFAQNNITSLQKALALSSVDGERYETKVMRNPSKGELATAIGSYFKDANAEDVSVIYIVSHGHSEATTSNPKLFNFGVTDGTRIYSKSDPASYVTSTDLMNYMRNIRGNVVLLLDSCTSGQFIIDTSDQMALWGNISVMTAQRADVRASWFNGDSDETKIEFFTYALCYGMGLEMLNTYLTGMPADNNPTNNELTIDELFRYAYTKTIDTIAEKRRVYPKKVVVGGGSEPESGWYQQPQIYIGLGLSDTILSARN